MSPLIPIQNLYYLFVYAWNRLDEGEAVDVGGTESPELADLFAKVLTGGVKHVIRRGLYRGYEPMQEETGVLRGRINIPGSMHLIARRAPRLSCEFDELTHDVLHNQILKSTISRLLSAEGLDRELAHELRLLLRVFDGVSDVRLSKLLFRNVQIHRNNSFYDFLLKVCELICDLTLPEEGGNEYKFVDILRDEKKMAKVFENFVRNFYRLEQDDYRVTPLQMRWDAKPIGGQDLSVLPWMLTDIHLESRTKRVIIDTKYYREALQESHGKRSLKSENLYQLFAYVKNAEAKGNAYSDVEGMLLYPVVGDRLDVNFEVQGHRLRAVTIDLSQPWQRIRSDLLGLLS